MVSLRIASELTFRRWIASVEVFNFLFRVFQMVRVLPCIVGRRISLPAYLVLQFPAEPPRIQHLLHLKLLHSIDLNWRRRGLYPAFDAVRFVLEKERDMEHWVNLHSSWEFKLIIELPDLPLDRKWTETAGL